MYSNAPAGIWDCGPNMLRTGQPEYILDLSFLLLLLCGPGSRTEFLPWPTCLMVIRTESHPNLNPDTLLSYFLPLLRFR